MHIYLSIFFNSKIRAFLGLKIPTLRFHVFSDSCLSHIYYVLPAVAGFDFFEIKMNKIEVGADHRNPFSPCPHPLDDLTI